MQFVNAQYTKYVDENIYKYKNIWANMQIYAAEKCKKYA